MPQQPSVQRWTWTLLVTALWFVPTLSAQAGNFSAHLTAAPASYQGICPGTIKFSGEIRATQPGKVQFQYIRSDGAPSPVQTLLFGSAGSKPLSTTWTLGSPSLPRYTGWIAIQFVHPQTDRSNPASFSILCTNKPR